MTPANSNGTIDNDQDEVIEELNFEDGDEYDEDNIDGTELAEQFEKLLASGLVRVAITSTFWLTIIPVSMLYQWWWNYILL